MVPLSDDEKTRIFKCIRYSYLTQEQLLRLSTEADFNLAKQLIVQGLACRLGGADQFASEELLINVKAREVVKRAQEATALAAQDAILTGQSANAGAGDTIDAAAQDGTPSLANIQTLAQGLNQSHL